MASMDKKALEAGQEQESPGQKVHSAFLNPGELLFRLQRGGAG